MSTGRLTVTTRRHNALPVLTFIASSFGGASLFVGVGAFANWTLGGRSATPTMYGFFALAVVGAILGIFPGSIATMFVALFMRPLNPRQIHFQIAILLGIGAGLIGSAICLPFCIHLPIELRQTP
jgi:hypothetical protein